MSWSFFGFDMSTSKIRPISEVSVKVSKPSNVGSTHLNPPYGMYCDIAQPYKLLPRIYKIILKHIIIYKNIQTHSLDRLSMILGLLG
jgi:hypothetical protein